MRFNHIVAALAVVACLSFASSAFATGACCNSTTGACTIEGVETDCTSSGGQFFIGDNCGTSLFCGACFDAETDDTCDCLNEWTTQAACAAATGAAYVDGVRCVATESCPVPPVPPVPAVSEWGMASVVLLLLAGLTIKFGMVRFRKAA